MNNLVQTRRKQDNTLSGFIFDGGIVHHVIEI